MKQMQSLASSLTSLKLEFSNDLTYPPGMASKSANQAFLENGGIQVLSKRDTKTFRKCRSMAKRGEYPPLLIVYDSCEGLIVTHDLSASSRRESYFRYKFSYPQCFC
uniref:Probable histone-lysine N-methyltransferase ATXR5 n=1 Tax=Tanacetum cinerariifolium TaxID=118510 RepID=A0A699L473_TANCI|nr:probable histone-lysine N-methyltransferase ATXR5 [Tanacetum cinerariifolium]